MRRKLTSEVDRNMVISYIKRLDISKLYTVEVTEKKAKRSISQNALYWLWLTCISHETGNDKDVLHDFFKFKYLSPEVIEMFDERIFRYSTTKLTTSQFKEYLDMVQVFASTELAIKLPDSKDKYWDEFYKYYVDKL